MSVLKTANKVASGINVALLILQGAVALVGAVKAATGKNKPVATDEAGA